MHQPGCVVVIGRRSATVRTTERNPRVRPVMRRISISVVKGVPEEPVIVGGLVSVGVVDVDVDDVRGEFDHQALPSPIAGAQELVREAGDRVVLIVVMRHEHAWSGMTDRFVIAVDIPEVPPAILVGDLSLLLEAMGAIDGGADERRVSILERRQKRNRCGRKRPCQARNFVLRHSPSHLHGGCCILVTCFAQSAENQTTFSYTEKHSIGSAERWELLSR